MVSINFCPRSDTLPAVHEVVLRWFPPGAGIRVLHAGAGEGALSQALQSRGYRVIACDGSPARFRAPGIPCVQSDINAPLPLASGFFDAVTSTEALEHLENPHHLSREFARILRPGGTLVLTTPNILQVYSRIHFCLLGTCDFFDNLPGSRETAFHGSKGHINPIGFPELRYAMELAGFEIREVATNRHIGQAIRNGTVRMALARFLIRPLALLIRTATVVARRADPIAMRLLEAPLLFGEDLIVRAERTFRAKTNGC
jgi:SAM-dependent methyltransferase